MNLESEVRRLATADSLHVDIMDGHFVPMITLGLQALERICEVSPIPIDCHLHTMYPRNWAFACVDLGVSHITIHVESSESSPLNLIHSLRTRGAQVGVGLKPATPLINAREFVSSVDSVLLMGNDPGFHNQGMFATTFDRIRRLHEMAREDAPALRIIVDGAVTAENIGECVAAGADTFVVGRPIMHSRDAAAVISKLRSAAEPRERQIF